MAWARVAKPRAERLYADAVARFVSLANDFTDRLAPDAPAANLKREEFLVDRGFRQEAPFVFTSMLTLAEPGVATSALDWLRTRRSRHRSSSRDAGESIGTGC